MDDYVLRLEIGEGALEKEERGALFKVACWMSDRLLGEMDKSSSFKDAVEIIKVNGEYARVSRLTIRNLGCIIGAVVNVEYFSPTCEKYIEELIEVEEELDSEDDDSYIGRHISLCFDSTDGSFYKYDSLSRLYIDEEGEPEIIPVNSYCENNCTKDEDFEDLVEAEATTPTVDDYFIVNTVRMIIKNKFIF